MSVGLIILCGLLFVLGIVRSSDKIITGLILLFMWILFAFNTQNGDYSNYIAIYNGIGNGSAWALAQYEEGYIALCILGYRILKLDYANFMILVATITTLLLCLVVRLYSKNKQQNIVYILFMVFLYWMMICQYRSYISFLLTMIGIYFLIERDDWKGNVLFVLFVLLAFTFHRSSILYLLYLVAKKMDMKRIRWIIPIACVIVILPRYSFFNNIIARFLPAFKMTNWLYSEGNRSTIGILLLIAVRILLILIENSLYKAEVKRGADTLILNRGDMLCKMSTISLAFLTLEIYNKNYERLFRIPLMLAFFLFTDYLSTKKIDLRRVPRVPIHYFIFVGYLGLYMAVFYVSFSGWFEHNLIPIFTFNSLLG